MNMSLSELWELVMDREAWRAVIHGVTKSWTQLSDWTELNWKPHFLKTKTSTQVSRSKSLDIFIVLKKYQKDEY